MSINLVTNEDLSSVKIRMCSYDHEQFHTKFDIHIVAELGYIGDTGAISLIKK